MGDKSNLGSIVTIAQSAYRTHPFYQWFYGKMKCDILSATDWREIPVLTKADLFEYMDTFGISYYDGPSVSDAEIMLQTSGTLGKSIEVPMTLDDINEYIITPFMEISDRYAFDEMVITYIDDFQHGWGRISELIQMMGISTDPITSEEALDPGYLKRHWNETKPNMILDTTGLWTYKLIKQGFDFDTIPLRAILGLEFSDEIVNFFRETDVHILRLFGSTENGIFAFTPPDLDEYLLCNNILLCVQSEDGSLHKYGNGHMIQTNDYSLFPWINYDTEDLVYIQDKTIDGVSYRIMRYYGRKYSVKIPDIYGSFVNINAINYRLQELEFTNFLIIKCGVQQDGLTGDRLLTIIESNEVSDPLRAPGIQREILTAGFGDSSLSPDYYPAVLVPDDTIPNDLISDVGVIPKFIDMTREVVDNDRKRIESLITYCHV